MSPKHRKHHPIHSSVPPPRPRETARPAPGSDLNPRLPETPEPVAARRRMPVGLIVLLGILTFWGGIYLDRCAGEFNSKVYEPYVSLHDVEANQPKGSGISLAQSQQNYEQSCQLCHMANGQGQPGQFPPLAGSEWVLAESPTRIIRIVLQGFKGPVQVKGQAFNNQMNPWHKDYGGTFDDDQIAGILTYVRQAWGNNASPVTPDQVKAVHQKVAARVDQWTAPELEQIPPGQ